MPYKMRKMPNRPCYKVYNKESKKVYSKCTTKKKAKSQMRLLRMLEGKGMNKTLKNKK